MAEQVGGRTTKTYLYALGRRVSQTAVAADGAKTDGFFGYNPHTDVETVTDTAGDTRSTYGYTAYGNEALEAVEEWEFDTRLGVTQAQARALRDRLNDVLRAAYRPE